MMLIRDQDIGFLVRGKALVLGKGRFDMYNFDSFGAFVSNVAANIGQPMADMIWNKWLSEYGNGKGSLQDIADVAADYLSESVIADLVDQTNHQSLKYECNNIMQSDMSDLAIAQHLDQWCGGDSFSEQYNDWLNEY